MIFSDNSFSIGRTPLVKLNRVIDGAPVTMLARIMSTHHIHSLAVVGISHEDPPCGVWGIVSEALSRLQSDVRRLTATLEGLASTDSGTQTVVAGTATAVERPITHGLLNMSICSASLRLPAASPATASAPTPCRRRWSAPCRSYVLGQVMGTAGSDAEHGQRRLRLVGTAIRSATLTLRAFASLARVASVGDTSSCSMRSVRCTCRGCWRS